MKDQDIIKEFFNKLAEELEEDFEKGERCQCGSKLPCRGKALAFNGMANVFLREALKAQREEILEKIENGLLIKCECENGDCPNCQRICGLLDELRLKH